ncbi:GNAT family N-acetyltransferase [Paractinoplanes rhizophilus]|uniref:GNAT family N-acetyltransferase n=1 Tax=Paractinoplanes rhizophilus TaxID=1416877 RepID=A0ABW2HWJ3_9ACTN
MSKSTAAEAEHGLQAHLFLGEPPGEMLAAGRAVYAAAFGRPPYHEGPEQADGFVARVRRYASERDGVRVVIVTDDAGPIGLGLALLARPGDWWRDRAAEAVGDDRADRWMGDLCLEVVHLAVHPRAQGRGFGKLAHDLLIAGSPAATAILACNSLAEPACHLYARRGWTAVAERFSAGGGPGDSLLMARDI